MKPIIRAAVDSGRPPLELLLDEPGRRRTTWDGKLIKALYLNEAFEVEGYPIWIEESPNVTFEAKSKVIRSLAVVEKAQDAEANKKNPTKGKRFYAEAVLVPGKTWPTRKEWQDRQGAKEVMPEVRANEVRISEAEARAKAKVAENPELQALIAQMEAKRNSRAGKMG